MRNLKLVTALLFAGVMAAGQACAADHHDRGHDRGDFERDRPFTIAAFGDWPYKQVLFENAQRLIDSINSDRAVQFAIHLGDIHAGSQVCTSADILPPIPTSDPDYDQQVYAFFQKIEVPVIYTPGDNEWTDCHKSKEGASGAPLKELASVRNLFFARPGHTLGLNEMEVRSQALHFDPAHPEDKAFVENVMWERNRVVFVTLNVPGSNDDTKPWTGTFADPSAQANEVATREAANMRWLDAAFRRAQDPRVRAMVIGVQADMWDPEAQASNELTQYTPFVTEIANRALDFGRPVLLLNGDSHMYGFDRPLADPTSATGVIHNTPAVPNLLRITVQGSTNAPAEWLRLTIDPRRAQPFTWVNVPYCADPTTSCN